MGFLSAIFKVFFPSGSRSTKPEKSERDYDLEEWERNKKLLTKAMTETLELTSFSYDTKSKFLKQIDTYLSKQESNEKCTLFDLLYPIVKDTGSVRISVSGEVIPGAAQRGCPLYLRCSMPDLMR